MISYLAYEFGVLADKNVRTNMDKQMHIAINGPGP